MIEAAIPKYIKPNDPDSLGVLGNLIVMDRQIHSYELKVLEEYLDEAEIKIEETCLDGIIKGTDTNPSREKYFDAFSRESQEVQMCFLYLLYLLAYVDNNFDDHERSYIDTVIKRSCIQAEIAESFKSAAYDKAAEIRNINNTLFIRRIFENKKTVWQRIIEFFISLFNKLFKRNDKSLADSKDEYKKSIVRCSEIALEDLNVLEPVYIKARKTCLSTVDSINDYRKGLSLSTELSSGVSEVVAFFTDVVNKEVSDQLVQEQYALEQKKRTVSDFTVSLLGRTKAGKTTLHSILTHQGKDMIGVGKQRTTRYNRVYQWNLLRIIDTPGIGSAEADGRRDEEIAESVLGESDIICFVVADDSILSDILDFIEKIASLNKPIIILLNHKDNIRPEVKFRRFIMNPDEWLRDEGESSLRGYESRIRRFSEEKGFSDRIFVYPVFLLAAQMAEEENYAKYSELLWNSSNIEIFIEHISEWILKSGTIKRSQTLLDESILVFDKAIKSVYSAENLLKNQITHLQGEKKTSVDALKKIEDRVLANVKNVIEIRYDDLAKNKALTFAEEYVDSSNRIFGKNLDAKWNDYRKQIGFDDRLRTEINKMYGEYEEEAKDITGNIFENMYYSMDKAIALDNIAAPMNFDFKRIGNILLAGVGILGSILGIASGGFMITTTVLTVLNCIFTPSKEERKRKAVNNLYNHIRKKTLEEKNIIVVENTDKLKSNMTQNTKVIAKLYDDLISGLEWVKEKSDIMIREYGQYVVELNKIYSWRILQFLEKKNEKLMPDEVYKEIIGVDRSEPDTIRIITRSLHKVEREDLNTVIAEKVIVEARKDNI